RQARLSPEPLPERLALEQLHGQEGGAVLLADLVDADDVVVADGGGRAGPAQGPFAGGTGRGPARQAGPSSGRAAADAGVRLGQRVFGAEADAHAALAEHLEDAEVPEPAHVAGLLRRRQE